MKKKIIFCPLKKNNMYVGILNVANNDDSDEYLKIKYKKSQVEINNNPNSTFIQNKIPT